MAIPPQVLYGTMDILRMPPSNDTYLNKLTDLYEDELRPLTREYDWFFEIFTMDTVIGQYRYEAPEKMRRLVSVAYKGRHLGKVTGESMDRLNRNWQLTIPGTPSRFWINETPDPIVTPQSFYVYPAPSAPITNGLKLYTVASPPNEDAQFRWLVPGLIAATASAFLGGSHILRDQQSSQFFRSLADLWYTVVAKRMPR